MSQNGSVWGGLTTVADDVGDGIGNAFVGTFEAVGEAGGGLFGGLLGGFGKWMMMMAALGAVVLVAFAL